MEINYLTLNELANNDKNAIVDGPFGSSLKTSEYVDSGIPVLQGKNITGDKFNFNDVRYITEQKAKELSRSKVVEGDILIIKIGSIGYSALIDNLNGYPYAIIPANLAKISLNKEKVHPRYFLSILRNPTIKKKLRNLASKTAQPALSLKKIKEFAIPIPEKLEDQIRIASLLSRIEELIAKRKESIRLLDEFVKSTFLEMFGHYSQNYKDWPLKAIKELASKNKGGMRTGPFGSNLLHSEFTTEGDVAVLGIDNAVNNKFEWKDKRYISSKKYEGLKNYTIYPRDVIITIMGTTGRSAVVPDDIPLTINTKHLAAITLDESIANPFFLAHSIHSNPIILSQLKMKNRGAIMSGLNLGIIKKLKIKVPPIELQNKFEILYNKVEVMKIKYQKSLSELEKLYGSVSQRAFRDEM